MAAASTTTQPEDPRAPDGVLAPEDADLGADEAFVEAESPSSWEAPEQPPEPPPEPKHKLRVPRARRGPSRVLVGTRKGAFCIEVDAKRSDFELRSPWHLGATCFHVAADPRDRKTVLAAATSPDGRPTVLISNNAGETWRESAQPPRFRTESPFEDDLEGSNSEWARSVHQTFWLTPGHPYQPRSWFCGTSPQGLFRSDDGGDSWEPVEGLHEHPEFDSWTSPGSDRTPDGPKLHSVLLDPRDPDHLYVALSSGGILETLDGGADWMRVDGGLEGDLARDPHAVAMAVTNPDRLWMQSHFGVYRMDREDDVWLRVGPKGDDGAFHDAGFPIVCHPADPDVAWVVPMDNSEAWSRMPIEGRAAVFKTEDAGESWLRQDAGLPKTPQWWTVKRQCLAVDGFDPLGIYFGTSTGEVWCSTNEGKRWKCIARGLPHIYSVEIG